MDTNTLTIIIVAVLAIAAIMLVLVMSGRKRQTGDLKQKFGSEYDHAVQQYGGSHKAETELQSRQKRVAALDIHPLTTVERDRFAEQWKQTQGEFVDAPEKAVIEADYLVKQAMQQRGYPVGDFEQRTADISVDRPSFVTHYRTAHEIALKQEKGTATTEDLRQAMVHYRALFEDLLKPDTDEKMLKDDGKVRDVKVSKDNQAINDNTRIKEEKVKEHAR